MVHECCASGAWPIESSRMLRGLLAPPITGGETANEESGRGVRLGSGWLRLCTVDAGPGSERIDLHGGLRCAFRAMPADFRGIS